MATSTTDDLKSFVSRYGASVVDATEVRRWILAAAAAPTIPTTTTQEQGGDDADLVVRGDDDEDSKAEVSRSVRTLARNAEAIQHELRNKLLGRGNGLSREFASAVAACTECVDVVFGAADDLPPNSRRLFAHNVHELAKFARTVLNLQRNRPHPLMQLEQEEEEEDDASGGIVEWSGILRSSFAPFVEQLERAEQLAREHQEQRQQQQKQEQQEQEQKQGPQRDEVEPAQVTAPTPRKKAKTVVACAASTPTSDIANRLPVLLVETTTGRDNFPIRPPPFHRDGRDEDDDDDDDLDDVDDSGWEWLDSPKKKKKTGGKGKVSASSAVNDIAGPGLEETRAADGDGTSKDRGRTLERTGSRGRCASSNRKKKNKKPSGNESDSSRCRDLLGGGSRHHRSLSFRRNEKKENSKSSSSDMDSSQRSRRVDRNSSGRSERTSLSRSLSFRRTKNKKSRDTDPPRDGRSSEMDSSHRSCRSARTALSRSLSFRRKKNAKSSKMDSSQRSSSRSERRTSLSRSLSFRRAKKTTDQNSECTSRCGRSRSRSRSRSRRRSSRSRSSQRSSALKTSILGGTVTDTDDEDIESLFDDAKTVERKSILDISRRGPVRALDRTGCHHSSKGDLNVSIQDLSLHGANPVMNHQNKSSGYLPVSLRDKSGNGLKQDINTKGKKSPSFQGFKSNKSLSLRDLFAKEEGKKKMCRRASSSSKNPSCATLHTEFVRATSTGSSDKENGDHFICSASLPGDLSNLKRAFPESSKTKSGRPSRVRRSTLSVSDESKTVIDDILAEARKLLEGKSAGSKGKAQVSTKGAIITPLVDLKVEAEEEETDTETGPGKSDAGASTDKEGQYKKPNSKPSFGLGARFRRKSLVAV